jgi:CBS domain containing-hemolysin-like protein
MAAVEDSEGIVIGIVTMEDVLEEIVGEIQDEYDDDEVELIREVNPGRFLVHGKVEVDDLCKVINADLGQKDQHVTLSQWFDKMCTAECANARRLKVGRVRVIRRERGRFEILIRWPSGVHPGPGGE